MSPVIDDALKEGTRGSPNVTGQMFLVLHRKTDAATGASLAGHPLPVVIISFSWFNLTQAVRLSHTTEDVRTGRV